MLPTQSSEKDWLCSLILGLQVGALDMVQLGLNRAISFLGRGDAGWRLTNPPQGIGRQSLPHMSTPRLLSYSWLIVDTVSLRM